MTASGLLTSPPGLLASSLGMDLAVVHIPYCANAIFNRKQRISYVPSSVFSRMCPALGTRAQTHTNIRTLLQVIRERLPAPVPPDWEGIADALFAGLCGGDQVLSISKIRPFCSPEFKLTAKALCCIAQSRKSFPSVPVRHRGKDCLSRGIPCDEAAGA